MTITGLPSGTLSPVTTTTPTSALSPSSSKRTRWMWRTLKNSFLKSKAKGNDRLHRNERVASLSVLRILYAADAEDYLLHFQPIRLDGWQSTLSGAAAHPLGFQRNRGLERHPDPDPAASGGQRGRRQTKEYPGSESFQEYTFSGPSLS